MKIERVVDSVELGEGPHWDERTQSLYFVDIFGKSIHKYTPATKKHTKARIGVNHVSFIVPVEGSHDQFLIGIGREVSLITWDGESQVTNIKRIVQVDKTKEENRINDAKCDPSGRLWLGTMGAQPVNGYVEPHQGSLYSLNMDHRVTTHLTEIGVSNGLAWSLDHKWFYYIDTHKNTVDRFPCNLSKGSISHHPETIFTWKNLGGLDGMTIDTDGNLWVAVFGGDCVIKIDPNQPEHLLETITIPAHQVTSVAFGGSNLDELYVTTARLRTDGIEYHPPAHGATYVVTGLGVRGLPGVCAKLG